MVEDRCSVEVIDDFREKTLRVAVLEDAPELLRSLQEIINSDPILTVVALFNNAEEAINCYSSIPEIDLFLVDLSLPGMNGIGFIKMAKRKWPRANYLVYTVSENSSDLRAALAVGANGYVLKGCSAEELVDSLKIIGQGNTLLSSRMAAKLMRFFKEIGTPVASLSARELEVLEDMKSGLTYEQIAESLCISVHTVHTHIKKIYKKLNVNDRNEAVKTAVMFDLI